MHQSRTPDDVAKELIQRAELRAKNPGALQGYSWGLPTLDQWTYGIQARSYVVLISRPNTGKSALAAGIGLAVAQQGGRVKIATFEMSAAQYQHRMACFLANVPLWRIDSGHSTPEERLDYVKAQGEIAKLEIEYQESADSFGEMERFFQADSGADLGIIDHIGIVPGFYGESGWTNAAKMSQAVAKLAHHNFSIIALGHQNRESLKGDDKRPTQESVAGSDGLTRDADLILGLYREDQWVLQSSDQANDPKVGELLVLKNRYGAANRVLNLLYNPTRTEWKEIPQKPEKERKKETNK